MIGLTQENAEDKLIACFLQRWNELTPVVLRNVVPKELTDSTEAWVHFTVDVNASRQDSLGVVGNRRFLRVGRIFAEVFVKAGSATGLQTDLTNKIANMYEDGSWSPMRIHTISKHPLPDGAHRRASITGDGRWFGTQVNIQFSFDEVK